MKPTVRAFIAVEISPSIRNEARKTLRPVTQAYPNVKWVEEENFHVTLKFLGTVPTTDLHRVVAAVERGCRKFEQFDLVFEGVGAFPNAESPRSIWIGVREGAREIRELARRIEAELAELGYPPENREFTPHLTVGRARQKDRESGVDGGLGRMIFERSNVFFGASPVDAVLVYSSELERGGPKYDVLAEIPLSPIGVDEEEAFDPKAFDDEADDALRAASQIEFAGQFQEKLDAHFDVDALDADVEAELRQICGADFAGRNGKKTRSTPSNGGRNGRRPDGKTPKKPVSLPKFEDVPELDDLDLSAFADFTKSSGVKASRPGRRPPKK
ncbi:MAG: RNA 2',3'-cyclic phosphodiesterase [Thermoguttaceae bacterium]|nr:RNA 2',3'-cyclic phosphodiesterase [Thermoguttaceae bacterium]